MSEGKWIVSRAIDHRMRVRYAETDQAGIVYHANFLIWFHEARDAAFRAWHSDDKIRPANWHVAFADIVSKGRSVGNDSLEEIGYRFLVVETSCKYVHPARYGDEIIVTVIPRETRVAKMMFAYKVRNARTQRLLAEGETASVIIGKSNKMLVRMPPEFAGIFQPDPELVPGA